jgi:hypothetical protein
LSLFRDVLRLSSGGVAENAQLSALCAEYAAKGVAVLLLLGVAAVALSLLHSTGGGGGRVVAGGVTTTTTGRRRSAFQTRARRRDFNGTSTCRRDSQRQL